MIGFENLAIDDNELPLTVDPLASPAFNGTLELTLHPGMTDTARRLLDRPNGLHFRKLKLLWRDKEGLRWTAGLVAVCSNTLESLDVTYELGGAIHSPSPGWTGDLLELPSADAPDGSNPVNLSKATKLKDVAFHCGSLSHEWIAEILETITPQHSDVQRISIRVPDVFGHSIDLGEVDFTIEWDVGEDLHAEWLDLDRLLVQFCESRSIRPTIVYPRVKNHAKEMREWAGFLLPEVTKRGIADLVEASREYHIL